MISKRLHGSLSACHPDSREAWGALIMVDRSNAPRCLAAAGLMVVRPAVTMGAAWTHAGAAVPHLSARHLPSSQMSLTEPQASGTRLHCRPCAPRPTQVSIRLSRSGNGNSPRRWPGGVTDALDDRDGPDNGEVSAPSSHLSSPHSTSPHAESRPESGSHNGFFPPDTASSASNGTRSPDDLRDHKPPAPVEGLGHSGSPARTSPRAVPDRWQDRQRSQER